MLPKSRNILNTTLPRPSLLMCVAVLVMLGIGTAHWARIELGIMLPLLWLCVVLLATMALCLICSNIIPVAISGFLVGATLDTMQWRQYDAESSIENSIYEAVIIDAPRHAAKTTQAKVRLANLDLSPVMLTMLRDTTLLRGQHILFKGDLVKVRPALRPYFHYDTWLFHQGVYWRAFAPGHILVPDSTFTLCLSDRLLARLRSTSISYDSEAVVEAMVLGSKSRITSQLREEYADAGGSHLLALSGLHLGILAGVLMLLVGRQYRYRYVHLFFVLPIVWGYVWLTGAPASLVRAATMFSMWNLTEIMGRRIEGRDCLTIAVLLIIGVRPFWLFDTGFQLSALSLLGLTSISTASRNWNIKLKKRSRVINYIAGVLLMGLVATIATAPIVAATFHRLPLWGWVMGIVYIPIVTVVVPLSFLLIIMPYDILAESIDFLLQAQRFLMQHTGEVIDNLYPSWLTVAVSYALMLLFVYRRYVAMVLAAVTLVLSMAADRCFQPVPKVYFENARAIIFQSRSVIHRLPCADTTYYNGGLYSYGDISILRVDNRKWKNIYSPSIQPVSYLWVCRGYNAHISDLLRCVAPQQVVLDSSLSPFYRERFEHECDSLGIASYSNQTRPMMSVTDWKPWRSR